MRFGMPGTPTELKPSSQVKECVNDSSDEVQAYFCTVIRCSGLWCDVCISCLSVCCPRACVSTCR